MANFVFCKQIVLVLRERDRASTNHKTCQSASQRRWDSSQYRLYQPGIFHMESNFEVENCRVGERTLRFSSVCIRSLLSTSKERLFNELVFELSSHLSQNYTNHCVRLGNNQRNPPGMTKTRKKKGLCEYVIAIVGTKLPPNPVVSQFLIELGGQ